jgi:sugar phosphate isomerase/epimerase
VAIDPMFVKRWYDDSRKTMLVGIDSYCFHRYFGEVYPQQISPSTRMTMEDFIMRAQELGADGVSLESCFFPEYSKEYLTHIKAVLDQYQLERVYAWGHPNGLEGGNNQDAYRDMLASFERARAIGATVMRVVGSSLMFRKEPHER